MVSQGDEQSAKRIAFLLMQYNEDLFFDGYGIKKDLLELAKSIDNQYVLDVLGEKEDDKDSGL